MFSKFSVKKPYTVIVGVVMVLLLGVISFMNSTTDLLPAMELPYVVVYTTYPGASAEKVENSLTRVLEASVSTTENLTNMSSVSSDNLSLIILQFADDTNMDTAMIDLNAKIDLVKGYLDDSCSTPTLMAINPNMMPIMMATVDYDGQNLQVLSDFVESKVVPELEKTKGVASVNTTGLLEETVQILLDQDKIDEINNKMLASVNSELAKTERDLRNSLKEVNEGLEKIENGQTELNDKKNESVDKLAESTVQLQQAAANLIAMDSQIIQKKMEEEAFEAAKKGYQEGIGAIAGFAGLTEGYTEQDILNECQKIIKYYNDKVNSLEQTRTLINIFIESIAFYSDDDPVDSNSLNPSLIEFLNQQKIDISNKNYGELKIILNQAYTSTDSLINNMPMILEAATFISEAINKGELADIETKLNNVKIEIATSEGVKQAATAALTQAGIDVSDLSSLQAKLEAGKITATGDLTKGELTLSDSKASLEAAKTQLEDGLKQFEEARDDALKSANITGILTPSMISNMLMAENFSMPAGYIASDDSSILIKVGDEFASLEEVENLLILPLDIEGLEEVKLKDLAEVRIIDNSDEIYTKINGNDGVMISFQKTSTASTAEVCQSINTNFSKLQEEYEGLHFTALMDQGVYIDMIIGSVLENFLYGAILAIIVLILFLKDIKPTLVIALSIPISLMFALVLMYFSGVTLNIISLSGLALGVGMLVDNSVVVVENIYRLRNEGVGLIKASIEGAKQVSGAIIASTLTTVCVFLPIVFATGLAKQLFVDMGLTIAYSLLASLIVALTLVPMLSSKLLKKPSTKKHPFFDAVIAGYEKSLAWSLNHKGIVMSGVVVLLLISVYSVTKMGMTLIPNMNSGQMSMTVTLLDEEATDKEAYAVYDQVIDRIKDIEGIDTIGVTGGGGSGMMSMMGSSSGQSTTFYIITDEQADIKAIQSKMQAALTDLPITSAISTSNMDLSVLGGSGVSITLYGNDLDELQQSASFIAQQLSQVEGIDEVSDGNEDPTHELRVIVDKNAAMEYGLTVAQVYQTIASGIQEETSSTTLTIENKDYPVVIVQDASSLITVENLESTSLEGTKNQETKEIELSDIASIKEGKGMSSIYRDNSRRYVTVTGTIKEGYNVTLVSREVEKQIDTSVLPSGVDFEYAGENETIMETMITLIQMILLAIAFIYMIMVAQFQSLLSPFIVMFTIPLAFTGGLLALILTKMELSVVAMLGFLVLCGVVVNNGIVFIDYANQLRAQGIELREALMITGKTRLRPILMTALTTILAMTTMALGIGTGSEMMQGMAIVTIGGLSYSTLLTLFVVPIMIEVLTRRQKVTFLEDNEDE